MLSQRWVYHLLQQWLSPAAVALDSRIGTLAPCQSSNYVCFTPGCKLLVSNSSVRAYHEHISNAEFTFIPPYTSEMLKKKCHRERLALHCMLLKQRKVMFYASVFSFPC